MCATKQFFYVTSVFAKVMIGRSVGRSEVIEFSDCVRFSSLACTGFHLVDMLFVLLFMLLITAAVFAAIS